MKTFKIRKVNPDRGVNLISEGTLEELIDCHVYTLECGKYYEREKGNKKINLNPKTVKALISNLNNAVNNAATNGYSSVTYSLVD
jgi:hypothetical protein